jgi:hypothetical protein
VSELYRPSDRRLSTKLLPTFADWECHVICVTNPCGRILGFLDWSHNFFFQIAPQLYSRGWEVPIFIIIPHKCSGTQYQCFEKPSRTILRIYSIFIWKQQMLAKCCCPSTSLHGVTSERTVLLCLRYYSLNSEWCIRQLQTVVHLSKQLSLAWTVLPLWKTQLLVVFHAHNCAHVAWPWYTSNGTNTWWVRLRFTMLWGCCFLGYTVLLSIE